MDCASARARVVLPIPGTSSMSRCPSHSSDTTASSTTERLPTSTRSTLRHSRSATDWTTAGIGVTLSVRGFDLRYVPIAVSRLGAVCCPLWPDDDPGMSFEARCPQCVFLTSQVGRPTPCLLHVSLVEADQVP